jgi:hypothetical protein
VKLEALDQPGVGESLQTPLRGGHGSVGSEPPVKLGRQQMTEDPEQAKDRRIDGIELELATGGGTWRPPGSRCSIQIEQLPIAVGQSCWQTRRLDLARLELP